MRTILLGLLCALGACGGTVTPDAESAVETGGETTGETSGKPPTSSLCCPISPAPACCMAFGGSDASCRGRALGTTDVCDNLPEPGDPRWQRLVDANGCPYWFAPKEIAIGCKLGEPPLPPPDQICKWTDDAGVHTETCAGTYGCCAVTATGTRCVPRMTGLCF